MKTASTATRQRKRPFDREQGVEVARRLFHARGYDAVSVADLTQALDVVPPSLYAAYGSKLGLFERALQSYVSTSALPLETILAPGIPPATALTDLLVAAAKHYTQDPVLRGCMMTEAMRADDPEASALAVTFAEAGSSVIRKYVAKHAKARDVGRIVDYVLLTLRGLSSYACLGFTGAKLVECAKVAGQALDAEFVAATPLVKKV
jgi:TetR/AcrR family transcriptional regulator, repressor for divergent bdcA